MLCGRARSQVCSPTFASRLAVEITLVIPRKNSPTHTCELGLRRPPNGLLVPCATRPMRHFAPLSSPEHHLSSFIAMKGLTGEESLCRLRTVSRRLQPGMTLHSLACNTMVS